MKENSLAFLPLRLKTRAGICEAEVTGSAAGGWGFHAWGWGAVNGCVLSCLSCEREATHPLFQSSPELSSAPCFSETVCPWWAGDAVPWGLCPFSTEQMFNVLEGKRVNRVDSLLWTEPGEPPGASHPSDPLRGHHCHPERPAAMWVLRFPSCPLFPSLFLRAKEEAPHTVAHSDSFSII